MSMNEREAFSAFLFGREDVEVLNIKFMRGLSPTLSPNKLCSTAQAVLQDLWGDERGIVDQPPSGRSSQRSVAEIMAAY